MTEQAVFQGSLVDAKNVQTHKCVRFSIDVPAEHAKKILEAFGWPTQVNPVSVAVARLNEVPAPSTTGGASSDVALQPATERGHKSQSQVAGYLCTLGSFQEFLREKFTDQWAPNAKPGSTKEEITKECIYDICAVTSRRDLSKDNTEWMALQLAYELWMREPSMVPA